MTALQPLLRLNLLPLWRRAVRVWGFEVSADSLDRLVYLVLHRLGWMGSHEKRFLEETVRPGMRVLDVGANLGLYTLLLSRLVGDSGNVVALEPDPELFHSLKTNCHSNGASNVELHNAAAGSAATRMSLARSLVNAGDNRLVQGNIPALTKSVEVRVATVDEIISSRRVDLVKIDVQGWEGEVFRGMRKVFEDNSAIQVLFEYWPLGLRKAGYEPVRLLLHLTELGFRIFEVGGGRRVPIDDPLGWNSPTGWKYTNLYAVRQPLSEPVAAA